MKIFQATPPDIPRVTPLMLSTATDNQGAQALDEGRGDQRDIDSYG
ncbi:hypothetical protein OB925_19615 [Aeromonas rivipollensis]|nr:MULTISPECIES: hypothetical protein [Aeromonas]MCE9955232.1 hypothetical protein [Aeromonas rivipollensis]MDM5086988.1 hypothetical protein [Aeromonas rivipollensis]MDM5099404.1 hypothetical protein [Aeromonas rivipollensis]MDM5107814.1 hypothetical protein [Aeromonas rivipollensis]